MYITVGDVALLVRALPSNRPLLGSITYIFGVQFGVHSDRLYASRGGFQCLLLTHKNAPEYADRVNLIKKIKVEGSWHFAPVISEPNGRHKDKVRVNGQVEIQAEGDYFIEWRECGKRCRSSVTREDAVDQARREALELRAVKEGVIAGPAALEATKPKTPIGEVIDSYLRFVKMHRKPRNHLTYRFTLDTLLRAAFKKKYVEDATRQDAIDFMSYCYELRSVGLHGHRRSNGIVQRCREFHPALHAATLAHTWNICERE